MATAPNFPRIVIDHARYWRGVPHVWSTTYFFGGDAWASGEAAMVATALQNMESSILCPAPTNGGGFIETRAYNAVTGAPAFTNVIGTLDTPSSWSPYEGDAWLPQAPLSYVSAAEVCFYIDTPLAGLSSTGKPVKSTKFMHSVSIDNAVSDATPDISPDVRSNMAPHLAQLFTGVGPSARRMISNGGRFASGPPTVRPFLGNHQMPQGRRKKKATQVFFNGGSDGLEGLGILKGVAIA